MTILDKIKKIFLITPFSWPLIAIAAIRRHEKARTKKGSNSYIQSQRVRPWFKDDPEDTRRYAYPLNNHSVVFDVGGYRGEYAAVLSNKFNCDIYIFEPVPVLYDVIKYKFSNNNKIHTFCFGLAGETRKLQIALMENASSVFVKSKETSSVQLKDINEFIHEHAIKTIDLLKLNIEGGEYELLESMIASGQVRICKNILVQFHDFIIPGARERMQTIQSALAHTHELTYSYEFVWENWKLK